LAKATLNFIRSNKDVDFLYNLKVAESPVYSKREIAHLVEIKNLIQKLLDIHLIVLIASVLSLSILCLNRKTRLKIPRYIIRGSLFLTAIIGILLITIFLDWNNLFLYFHNIFFTQGTFSFASSFAIIQLFPPRFWFDTALAWLLFILIEILTIVSLIWWITKRKAKKQKDSS
jgi:integral membrane protein (TIGR01906 family)